MSDEVQTILNKLEALSTEDFDSFMTSFFSSPVLSKRRLPRLKEIDRVMKECDEQTARSSIQEVVHAIVYFYCVPLVRCSSRLGGKRLRRFQ